MNDARYRLPQDLHHANLFEVGAYPLGDNHHHLSGTQRRDFSSPELRLYDGGDLLPVSWVGVFLPRNCMKPHPEVFGHNPGRASDAM